MTQQSIPFPSIDTPAVLLNLDQFEANVKEMSQLVTGAGIKLRPHIKVHQSPIMAKVQLEAGACGVEVGNLDQAAVMAEGGINDIVIAHPFYGERKFEGVKELVKSKPELKLTINVDMVEQAEGLSEVGKAVGKKIAVFIKVETGMKRYGVLPGTPVLELAKKIAKLPGVELKGIYAHESGAVPTEEGVNRVALEVGSIMAETARMLRSEGFEPETVCVGGSPTYRATCRYIKEGILKEITEVHPGQCVIGDIMYMMGRGNTRETCALTVLTTVVSTSHPNQVIIDAGYKTLGSDSLIARRDNPGFFWNGMPSFGPIQGRPDLWLGRLGAESAWLYYTDPAAKKLGLGERLEIVPNNATLVVNIHDEMYGVRNGVIEMVIPVTGRGRGS